MLMDYVIWKLIMNLEKTFKDYVIQNIDYTIP